MQIDDLKTLRKVIKLCQESGVTSISIDGITMAITPVIQAKQERSIFDNLELPPEANMQIPRYKSEVQEEAYKVATEGLTEEQLLFYSSRSEDPGHPEQ